MAESMMFSAAGSPQARRQENGSARIASVAAPKAFALPLRLSPYTTVHIQLTSLATSTLIFLTTSSPASASSTSALGSFVYAMPNRLSPESPPLSTPLYTLPSSIEFATRVAKIIAKRTKKPTYVGCSIVLEAATIDEEMEAMQVTVDGILKDLENTYQEGPVVNGVH